MAVGSDAHESKPGSTLARLVGAVAVAIGLPVGGIALVGVDTVRDNTVAAVVLVLGYEAVIGVLTFAATIMSELRERWRARIVESLDARVMRLTSRYAQQFIRYVRAHSAFIDLQGLTTRGEFTFTLDEIFVDLEVGAGAAGAMTSGVIEPQPGRASGGHSPAASSIWAWLRQTQRTKEVLVVLGPPGSGKTTLLKHMSAVLVGGTLARVLQDAPARIPVLVTYRTLRQRLFDDGFTLESAIRLQYSEIPAEEPAGWLEEQLRRGRLLVMLDGMDELGTAELRRYAASWTDRQRRRYPDVQFIVTSRPFGYRENPLDVASTVRISAFTNQQIRDFVTRWYEVTTVRSFGGRSDSATLAAVQGARELLQRVFASPALRDLATNPLLLTMMANVHHYRGALPGTRAELYDEVCSVFLGKRHQARGVESRLQIGQKRAVLQALALAMMENEVRDINAEDAAAAVLEVVNRVSGSPVRDPLSVIKDIEESSGLLLEREDGLYTFAHLTFQEYLAASQVREKQLHSELAARIDQSWWHETIRLYAAESDATGIIDACLAHPRTDLTVIRLAVECMLSAREVAASTRRHLLQLADPHSEADIAIAATIRLLLRSASFVSIDPYTEISPAAVSAVEFWYYVQQTETEARPVHWGHPELATELYSEPAMGLPAETIPDFLKWMTASATGPWRYRLPSVGEITQLRNHVGPSRQGISPVPRAFTQGRNIHAAIRPAETGFAPVQSPSEKLDLLLALLDEDDPTKWAVAEELCATLPQDTEACRALTSVLSDYAQDVVAGTFDDVEWFDFYLAQDSSPHVSDFGRYTDWLARDIDSIVRSSYAYDVVVADRLRECATLASAVHLILKPCYGSVSTVAADAPKNEASLPARRHLGRSLALALVYAAESASDTIWEAAQRAKRPRYLPESPEYLALVTLTGDATRCVDFAGRMYLLARQLDVINSGLLKPDIGLFVVRQTVDA